ncbi:MAG: hypothetical protein E6I76_12230 [Chloroflexi bacterium]|nr:MAG: hypothetical protein E6I76_12230 [Chloroflexota bacterium]
MKRVHGLLLAVLGAAAVSCGGSSTGAGAGAHVDQGASATSSAAEPATGAVSSAPASAAPAGGGAPPAGAAPQPGGGGSSAPMPVAPPPAAAPPGSASTSTPAPAGPGTPPQPAGWSLTVTYTAVESLHHGAPQAVTGCDLNADECNNGTSPLGSYPADFVDAVKAEGYGRITSGKNAGRYLAWDPQGGFSLETSAADAGGNALKPFVSAAADDSIPIGAHFTVQGCGTDATTHRPPDAAGCARLTGASWVVGDNTTQPWGSHALNLYVGEETQPDFTTTVAYVINTVNARTSLR